LHLHTRWSDGTQTLSELLARVKAEGLSAVAITDHDTIGPDLHSPVEFREGIEVITGVEVKAEILGSGRKSSGILWTQGIRRCRPFLPGWPKPARNG
jgi:predicted metal-dependent phosphoesterase TrpH